MSGGPYDNLPTWEEMCVARDWLMAGCPVIRQHQDPAEAVRILHKLVEGLPKHIAIYAWGSDEWRAERERLRSLEVTP
jgi:hypothetical protein